MSKNQQFIDVIGIVKDLHRCKAEGIEPPKLKVDVRRSIVIYLLDNGLQQVEISSLLKVTRQTIWADIRAVNESASNSQYYETIGQSAQRINRRSDFLWSKAVRDNDWRLAKDIEKDRREALQSIGMIQKVAERLEIKDDRISTREEAIEYILREVDRLGESDSNLEEGSGVSIIETESNLLSDQLLQDDG